MYLKGPIAMYTNQEELDKIRFEKYKRQVYDESFYKGYLKDFYIILRWRNWARIFYTIGISKPYREKKNNG